jgi:L-ribulokinase
LIDLMKLARHLPASLTLLVALACGAVAAGEDAGGYADIFIASERMGGVKETVYRPIPENVAVYDRLYADYKRLYDTFGRGENDVMKRLRALRREVLSG